MGAMERPTDHRGSEVLSREECDRLLDSAQVGRVAFLYAGDPHILPINYRFHQGAIIFRTTVGSKMDAAEMHRRFAFEIDGWDADSGSGWSVLAHGMGEAVTDPEETAALEGLGLVSWAGDESEDMWFRIALDDITGRGVG